MTMLDVGNMDMRWLEDFLAVADTRNFTRAAQSRNISQAAFSRRIKALESWLGSSLIDRASFPTRLTPDGERFRERAAEIVQQIADARLSGAEAVRRRVLGVGLPHSLATGRLPAWWNAWLKAIGPGVTCNVVSGDVNEIVAALMNAEVDILILYRAAHTQVALPEEQYDCVEIGEEILAPYAVPQMADRIEASMGDHRGEALPLLGYTKTSTFARAVEAILEGAPLRRRGHVVFEAESTSVLRAMAVAGHGVAWLPSGVAQEAPAGALRRIEGVGLSASLRIVAHRAKGVAFPALMGLWDLLAAGAYQAPFDATGGASNSGTSMRSLDIDRHRLERKTSIR
jgi:DNA-binding transcriptional LysR family regulator